MKKIALLFVLAAVLWLPACENNQSTSQSETTTSDQTPVMTFKEQEVNLGKMTEGDTLRHQFRFTNTGNAPLIVQSAVASCGCTVPTTPKEAIAPGKEGVIDVVFNSKNKAGFNTKTVTVYANTKPDMNTVAFKVEVLPGAGAKVQ